MSLRKARQGGNSQTVSPAGGQAVSDANFGVFQGMVQRPSHWTLVDPLASAGFHLCLDTDHF